MLVMEDGGPWHGADAAVAFAKVAVECPVRRGAGNKRWLVAGAWRGGVASVTWRRGRR